MRQQSKSQVSFFPMPQPDELLDSVVYRYHKLAGNAHPSQTLAELFNVTSRGVPRLLSNNSALLQDKVSPALFKDRKDLLARHSLLSAMGRIFDEWHIKQAVSDAENGLDFGTSRIYFSCHTLVLQDSFHCCPICIQEEQASLGFAYWHRSHQLQGVTTCHKHNCDLIQRCPHCGRDAHQSRSMDLPDSHCPSCGKRWLPSYSFPESVNRLANLAYDACNSGKFKGTDLILFANVVWATTNENTEAACAQMDSNYGPAYLRKVGPRKEKIRDDWLGRSFQLEMQNRIYGPWMLKFRRYADLLMTIDTFFGSWADFDRHVAKYRKLAA